MKKSLSGCLPCSDMFWVGEPSIDDIFSIFPSQVLFDDIFSMISVSYIPVFPYYKSHLWIYCGFPGFPQIYH